jgi:ATPase family associated with various cellular activities (AAA)
VDDIWKLLAGGAAFGVIAGFWSRIKDVVWRMLSLFIQQVEITSEPAHAALVGHLLKYYRRSRYYDRMLGAWYEHQRDGRYALVPCEVFGARTLLFWRGLLPFWYGNPAEKKARSGHGETTGGDAVAGTKVHATLTFLRGTFDVEALFRLACNATNEHSWSVESAEEKSKNRFAIHFIPRRETQSDDHGKSSNGLPWYRQGTYRLLAHTPEQLGKGPLHDGKALGSLVFPERVQNLILEIELWRNSREWYRDKGLSWKRGWLLFGPPGTGKTALARAFAEDLNMPIYVFNLAEMSNSDLMKAWNELQVNVPCIALIEDIDNVFHGRDNVTRRPSFLPLVLSADKKDGDDDKNPAARGPLTFDCLLNCLDGVERSDGIFTIVTTNDIAKVDPALGQPRRLPDGTVEFISTRPGRIDKAVELSYMEPSDKKRLADRILADYPVELSQVLDFIARYPDLKETPAQFQERCGQIALAAFWRSKTLAAPAATADPPVASGNELVPCGIVAEPICCMARKSRGRQLAESRRAETRN